MGTWDPTQDAWLAGFADGEGTFLVVYAAKPGNARGRTPCLFPRFSLNVRADDAAVLRCLREAFGGTLIFNERAHTKSRPRYFWHVVAKDDLRRVGAYFDQFPLRGKKAGDCALWLRAVEVYLARGGVRAFGELDAIRVELAAGRLYVAPIGVGADEPAAAPVE